MNLDDLLKEMKEKMQSRDLSDKYLKENDEMTRTEIGIGEYSYGITTVPCEWVYDFLSDYKRVLKENEELKNKVKGQECVIETQAHNEEVYEKLVIKLEKENTELKEYISIAPNLDEMTAVKYRNIQQDAYIKGRAEEQQRAEQIIYENYIPVQKVKDILNEINKEYIKQEEIFNKYFEKENRDMEAYYIQKEATGIMQELSWVEGKLQELLEGRKI